MAADTEADAALVPARAAAAAAAWAQAARMARTAAYGDPPEADALRRLADQFDRLAVVLARHAAARRTVVGGPR